MSGFTPSRNSGSIAGRALLAVILMIGFYVMAIIIAAAMLYLCYLIVVVGHRIPVKLVIILVVAAGAILWSIIPRIDRFVAPGPRLTREKNPKLFSEIESVARATGQEMPAEVYLESDVNAWVAQRGGIMGLGSRRIMGLGLGLMRVLNASELRAVLAHEFGHFHGGDTRLGPWVFKTRNAIIRTVSTLGDSFIQKPFVWYGKLFLLITHAVSRRQEFTADRLAATTIGKEALVSGLQRTHAAGMLFNTFWQSEVVPVLSSGFKPPIAEGFSRFMSCDNIATVAHKAIEEELQQGKGDPYDSHPPLKQRIEAVGDIPSSSLAMDKRPAVSLLDDVPGLETQLLEIIGGRQVAAGLKPTSWDQVGVSVWVPFWRRGVKESYKLLEGLTPENILEQVIPTLRNAPPEDEQAQSRINTLGAALTLAAVDAGASVECDPGAPVAVIKGDTRVETFNVINKLCKGELSQEVWQFQCEELGIVGIALADLGAAATA